MQQHYIRLIATQLAIQTFNSIELAPLAIGINTEQNYYQTTLGGA